VAVAGDLAYVSLAERVPAEAGVPAGLVSAVYCVDAATGAVRWRRDLGVTAAGWISPGGTPAVADGRVFVTYGPATAVAGADTAKRTKTIKVICLDAPTGDVAWEAEQPATTANITMHGGPYGSALVVDGVCVVQETGAVAYDAATGRRLWSQPCIDGAYASPTAWRGKDATLVLCLSNIAPADTAKVAPALHIVGTRGDAGKHIARAAVYALDLKTGAPQWAACVPDSLWNAPTPVICGDTLLQLLTDGLSAFRLDAQTPAPLWTAAAGVIRSGAHYGPSPAVADGFAYIPTSAGLTCVNVADGEVVATQALGAGGRGSGQFTSAAVADGKVIIFSADPVAASGTLFLLSAGPRLALLSQATITGIVANTSPTIADGKLYLRTFDGIACYDMSADAKPAS
jgi:outer membrane protein assembly factor BamB